MKNPQTDGTFFGNAHQMRLRWVVGIAIIFDPRQPRCGQAMPTLLLEKYTGKMDTNTHIYKDALSGNCLCKGGDSSPYINDRVSVAPLTNPNLR
ncbi:MAG: hypothetical protein AB4426_28065 [Xenococcaceae cyanobacterium]